jgi:hypothetical protein
VLSWAEKQLGKPSQKAAAGPAGFDPSGLAMDALAQAGITVPHSASGQWQQTMSHPVTANQLKPGDLVFFTGTNGATSNPGNVGIYIGGGQIIDASQSGTPVRFEPLSGLQGLTGATNPYSPAPTPGASVWSAAQMDPANVPAALSQYESFGRQLSNSTWGPSAFPYLYMLWQRESGWNPAAENPLSGAFGIAQALPATKMASAGPDWATDPYTQIVWGVGYISAAYGDPQTAWAHELAYGWY